MLGLGYLDGRAEQAVPLHVMNHQADNPHICSDEKQDSTGPVAEEEPEVSGDIMF